MCVRACVCVCERERERENVCIYISYVKLHSVISFLPISLLVERKTVSQSNRDAT